MESSNKKLKLEYKNKHKDRNSISNKDEKNDKKNIMDYFIIGEDENNDSISDISKQLEKLYGDISTFNVKQIIEFYKFYNSRSIMKLKNIIVEWSLKKAT